MDTKELEASLEMLKEVYFEGVALRLEDCESFGFTKSADFRMWEDWMNEALTVTRNRLIQELPEKYHFGKLNKTTRYKHIKKHSKYGDDGFIVCCDCRAIFKANVYEKRHGIERFENCLLHSGRKEEGKIQLTDGVDWEL